MHAVTSFARSGPAQGRFGAFRSLLRCTALAVAAVALFAPVAVAQVGAIAGIVTGAGGQPLSDAQVRLTGTDRAVPTDAAGRFRITGIVGTQAEIEVRRIGYRPARLTVVVPSENLRISLTEQSVALEQVIVTGTAGGQARRELGNAVSQVNASEVTELGTVSNIQQLLNARAPGVVINSATGNLGAGARIRVRGSSSAFLSNEPLIYVDGVRVNNQAATGPVNQAFGSSSISRINDINPEDIESIEIIKGPAAATLYGTEASNGVIQIITKRGAIGAPRWTFASRQGIAYVQDPQGRWPVNYQTLPRVGGPVGARDTVAINIMALEKARGTPVFTTGGIHEYDISTSGGSQLFRYYAAAGLEDSKGVEPTNQVERRTGRLNVQVYPSDQLNLGFNVGYTNGDVQLPCEAGCGGRTWTTISANPQHLWMCTTSTGAIVDCSSPSAANRLLDASGNPVPSPRRGFHTGLPEGYDAQIEYYQVVDRFTAGFQANQQPARWFRHRLTAGTDRTREENSALFRRISDSLFNATGTGGLGSRAMNFRTINNYTFDYSGSAVFDFRPNVRSTTSIGTQYYRNYYQISCAEGSQFPAEGVTNVSSTTANRATCHDIEEDATLGFFIQEQIGLNDRLFLTAAVRADDNSAFGRNFDRVYYPKFSVSWVVSDEPFWRWPMVEALKFRTAYGSAGKQPITFAALQTYQSATGPGNVPTVTPLTIGNPDLGPEKTRELEVGFDLGAWNDRIGAEVTYYRQRTVDMILDRTIAPSIGIPGTQPFNAGSVKNWGTELLLRLRPVVLDRFEWQTTFGYATNDSRVEDLGEVGDFVLAATGSLPPRHQVGYPIGSYFNKRVVSADFNPAGTVLPGRNAAINVMCDDGQGGAMPCANAPFVFLGRSTPRVEGSWSNSISFLRNFRAFALVDFKRDYLKIDGNRRVRCVVNIRCEEVFFPERFDPKLIAGVQAGLDVLPDFYHNDASYTRLREVSFSYTLPPQFIQWGRFNRAVVGVAGRNLKLWSKYPGLDPESFFLGGNRGGSFALFDQTTTPQTTHWVLSVNLDW